DIATYTISPLTIRLLTSAGAARISATLCSLVRWNPPASSVRKWYVTRLVNTLISAASEAVGADSAKAKPIVTAIRKRLSNRRQLERVMAPPLRDALHRCVEFAPGVSRSAARRIGYHQSARR